MAMGSAMMSADDVDVLSAATKQNVTVTETKEQHPQGVVSKKDARHLRRKYPKFFKRGKEI